MSHNSPIHFEQSIKQLEAIVSRMEQEELPIEQALEQFEAGMHLGHQCQEALKAAEQKVDILLNGQLLPFDQPTSCDDSSA